MTKYLFLFLFLVSSGCELVAKENIPSAQADRVKDLLAENNQLKIDFAFIKTRCDMCIEAKEKLESQLKAELKAEQERKRALITISGAGKITFSAILLGGVIAAILQK